MKNRKAIITLLLAASLAVLSAGCARGNDNGGGSLPASDVASGPPPTSSVQSENEIETPPSDIDEPEPPLGELPLPADLSAGDILERIAAAYGDNYQATGDMSADYITEAYPEITGDMYEDIMGNMSLISAVPDEVIVVKSAPGRADELEQALNDIKERKAADALQYAMNMPKTQSAKVVRSGDWLAYIMLGEQLENNDATDEERLSHFEKESQKGVGAFRSIFGA